MLQRLERLKLPLEVISVLLGIILGCMAVWQQIQPSGDLVAELVVTEARLPGDVIRDAKDLPQAVEADLLKSKDLLKLLPDDETRREALDLVKEVIERRSFSIHGFEGIRRDFMFVKIRNEGAQLLHEVKLGLRHPVPHSVTIMQADGTVKDLEAAGVISLGDLPPQGEIKVFSWGIALMISTPNDITVSHNGGVGEVQLVTPVPHFIWGNEGVFFSYRHTTYALFALMLIGVGALGLVRYRSRPGLGNT